MSQITITRRIYFDDTDSGGVVYHTNYLRFMEHARSEMLLVRGFGPQQLIDRHNCVFAVTELSARYLAPARLGDLIEIEAVVQSLKSVSIAFTQAVWLLNETQQRQRKLVEGEVKVVCLDAQQFRPSRIPASVEESLV